MWGEELVCIVAGGRLDGDDGFEFGINLSTNKINVSRGVVDFLVVCTHIVIHLLESTLHTTQKLALVIAYI